MSTKLVDEIIDFFDHLMKRTYSSPVGTVDLALKHFKNFSRELAETAGHPEDVPDVPEDAFMADAETTEPETASPAPGEEQVDDAFQVDEAKRKKFKDDPISILRTGPGRRELFKQALILREVLEKPPSLTGKYRIEEYMKMFERNNTVESRDDGGKTA